MMRRTLFGLSVKQSTIHGIPLHSKVGIFPIHLDPPTLQHEQLFRLLLGMETTTATAMTTKISRSNTIPTSSESVTSTPSNSPSNASSSAKPKRFRSITTDTDEHCCGEDYLAVPPRFAYLNSFAKSIREDSQLTPLEHLILIPNTQYPVSLKHSTHLAALSVLATRGLTNVHVDFTALEHPDDSMPIIQELTQNYENSVIIHWLHDAYEMQNWKGFSDMKVEVPLLLLQTTSYPPAALSRYRPSIEDTPCVLYSRQYHDQEELDQLNHGATSEEESQYYKKVEEHVLKVAAEREEKKLYKNSNNDESQSGDAMHASNKMDEHENGEDGAEDARHQGSHRDGQEKDPIISNMEIFRDEDKDLEQLVNDGNSKTKYDLMHPKSVPVDEVYSKYQDMSAYRREKGSAGSDRRRAKGGSNSKEGEEHQKATGEDEKKKQPPQKYESYADCVKGRWWRTTGGRGDDKVEISRSYSGSVEISWLGISFEEEADMETAAFIDSLPVSSRRGIKNRLRRKLSQLYQYPQGAGIGWSSAKNNLLADSKGSAASNATHGKGKKEKSKDSESAATTGAPKLVEDVVVLEDGSLEVKVHYDKTSTPPATSSAIPPRTGKKKPRRDGAKSGTSSIDGKEVSGEHHNSAFIPPNEASTKRILEEFTTVRADLEEMLRPRRVHSPDTNLNEMADLPYITKRDIDGGANGDQLTFNDKENDENMDGEADDDDENDVDTDDDDDDVELDERRRRPHVRTYHGFAPRNVRQLIEELYPPNPFYPQNGQSGQFTRGPIPLIEVHPIIRTTGADVRHALWEREIDPTSILSDAVLRYVDTHNLYRDTRKVLGGVFRSGTATNDSSNGYGHTAFNSYLGSLGLQSGTSSSSSSRKLPTQKDSLTMTFPGVVPRLELHYDKNNLLAREQYEKLKAFQCSDSDQEPDLIVPIGGDGYMMHCIRRNWDRFIPFYGVNAGHVGYLLNDCATLEELFSFPLKLHTTTMLYCQAEQETETGERVLLSELAFNDAWVERSGGQTALIRILVNGEERIRRLRGDGVLVSTAAGSTAYSQALGASPVPVGAPLIQVVGSNVVSPAQWRPAHLDQEDQVEFEVIDTNKRPCKCYVDSVDVGNVTRMLVRSSRVAGITLAFSRSCDLQNKLYQMQFPKTL